jgi:hypothetical protein
MTGQQRRFAIQQKTVAVIDIGKHRVRGVGIHLPARARFEAYIKKAHIHIIALRSAPRVFV